MNANEVKTMVHKIAKTSLKAGITDRAILKKISLYFALDTDREQEWAGEFATYYIDHHGAAAAVRDLVSKAGSQAAAAELLGVDQATVSRYLNGTEPSRPIVKLARMLLEHHF